MSAGRRYQAAVDGAAGGCLAVCVVIFRLAIFALFVPPAWRLFRDGHGLGALALLAFAGLIVSTFGHSGDG